MHYQGWKVTYVQVGRFSVGILIVGAVVLQGLDRATAEGHQVGRVVVLPVGPNFVNHLYTEVLRNG